MRRVVRSEGKVAALVFSTAEKNPYQGIALGVARDLGSKGPPLFSLGETHVLESAFRDSGLRNVAVHTVSISRHFSSSAEIIQRLKETAFLRAPLDRLEDSAREQAWTEIEHQLRPLEGPNGVDLPGEFLIAVGTK
jgi:hypothetical protein